MSCSRACAALSARAEGTSLSVALPLPSEVKRQRLHPDQIDNAGEGALFADGELDRNDFARAIAAERLERAVETRAIPLQAVHGDNAGQAVRGGRGPELLGLYLYARHGIDGRFDDAEGRPGIGEKVRESWRVDDVDCGLLSLDVS